MVLYQGLFWHTENNNQEKLKISEKLADYTYLNTVHKKCRVNISIGFFSFLSTNYPSLSISLINDNGMFMYYEFVRG